MTNICGVSHSYNWCFHHSDLLCCITAVVGARAFITSQCAEAHTVLFRRIFEIAVADTGQPVAFKHIHGHGYESVVADAHKGQALGMCTTIYETLLTAQIGLGRYCVHLCRHIHRYDKYEPQQRLCDLGPYDHLKRFFRICETHFQRNAFAIRHYVGKEVWTAMLSLSSSDPHPNIEETFTIIRSGGNKAKGTIQCSMSQNNIDMNSSMAKG